MSTNATVPAADPHYARRWIILVVLALCQLVAILDATVVNIALPTAQHDLGFTDGQRQWIVTGYALAFGSLLLFAGRLTDLFGRKRALIVGMAGFAGASFLGGAATNFGMLVTARILQGSFGALLAPAVLAVLTTVFVDGRERRLAFGVFGAIGGGGGAIGLLLGGVLTEYFTWRATLYVNIVFAVPAIIGASVLLHHTPSTRRPRLDIPGAVTITAGLFALVYGFTRAQSDGWDNPATITLLAAAAVLLAVFVIIECLSKDPLLPLTILLDRNRAGAMLALFLATAGMFSLFLFMTYYLQANLGYTAVRTGFAFLPMPVSIALAAAVIVPPLQRVVSPRILIPVGMLLGALSMFLLTGVGTTANYAGDILPSLVLLGLGMGTLFSTATSVAILGVTADHSGVASATVNAVQQVGGSIGIALLDTIAAATAATYLAAHPATNAAQAAGAAAVHGYGVAYWIGTAIFVGGTLLTALVLRSGVPEQLRHGSSDNTELVAS